MVLRAVGEMGIFLGTHNALLQMEMCEKKMCCRSCMKRYKIKSLPI